MTFWKKDANSMAFMLADDWKIVYSVKFESNLYSDTETKRISDYSSIYNFTMIWWLELILTKHFDLQIRLNLF